MPSGKQTSFEFGEVSPSLQFRSDAVSYSQGLAKLKNMFVRRDGGASNRSGFMFLAEHPNQIDIPSPGDRAGIKGFSFWSPEDNEWKILEYFNTDAVAPKYKFSINFGASFQPAGYTVGDVSPDKIRFTRLKDRTFISPDLLLEGGSLSPRYNNISINDDGTINTIIGDDSLTAPSNVTGTTHFNATLSAKADAAYLVTALMKDGQELFAVYFDKTSFSGAAAYFPDQYTWNELTLTWASATSLEDVKYFNWYRAAGSYGINGSFFKLAGRSLYDGSSVSTSFSDFGADDPSQTPPLDAEMLAGGEYLSGVKAAAYHQQRLIMAMKESSGAKEQFKAGDILASKLGATEQIKSPIIYADTGSFSFSVPVTDGTPVVALLALRGLIAFTERAVYYVRGGEGTNEGVLTPTSVNPLLISEEGCSKIVEPKMNGSVGYFVNASHTKLMAIKFSADGNLDVGEASIFSNHLMLKDTVQLEVLSGGENSVFLLMRDGTLVQANEGASGAYGFSPLETNGYVESIFRGKSRRLYAPNTTDPDNSEKYYDVLMAHVIRNGVRTLEQLVYREDRFHEGEFFADCFSVFGQRLSSDGSEGYSSDPIEVAPAPPAYSPYPLSGKINIKSATNYEAGTEVEIQHTAAIPVDFVVHFFYDENGEKQYLRFISHNTVGTIPLVAPFTNRVKGHFTADVPASLQDVQGQTLTTSEKNKRYTRWLPAFNRLEGDDALYGPWLAASSNPSADGEAEVTVFGDGEVVSSPLNPKETTPLKIVRSGGNLSLDLPDYYSFGYVGVPYTSELETLDLETSDNRTLTDARKLLNKVGVGLMETRGGYYGIEGTDIDKMQEIVIREDTSFNNQTKNVSGYLDVDINSTYSRAGRINIKQVDPCPISVLSVYPKGISGD